MTTNSKIATSLALTLMLASGQVASAKGGMHIPHVNISKHITKQAIVIANPPANAVSRAAVNVATAVSSAMSPLCTGAMNGAASVLVGMPCIPAAAVASAECVIAVGGPEDPMAAVCPGAAIAVELVCGAAGATFASSMIDPVVQKTCGND